MQLPVPQEEDNVDDQSPFLIKTDRKRLQQVLINLVSNAIKFSSYESEVTLRSVYHEQERRLTISVIDQGVGIEDHNKTKLFKLFGCI